jgi:hypothetical protein
LTRSLSSRGRTPSRGSCPYRLPEDLLPIATIRLARHLIPSTERHTRSLRPNRSPYSYRPLSLSIPPCGGSPSPSSIRWSPPFDPPARSRACPSVESRHAVRYSACHIISVSSRSARLAVPQDRSKDGDGRESALFTESKSWGPPGRLASERSLDPTLLRPSWKRNPYDVETISRARTRSIEPYHAADRGT